IVGTAGFSTTEKWVLQSVSPCCARAWRSSDTPSRVDGSASPSAQPPVSSRPDATPPASSSPVASSTASVTPAPPNDLTADTPATCPSLRGLRSGKAGIGTTTPPRTHHASATATNSTSAGSQSEDFARCGSPTSPHAEPQDYNECKRSPPHNISIGSPAAHEPINGGTAGEIRTISTAIVTLHCIWQNGQSDALTRWRGPEQESGARTKA